MYARTRFATVTQQTGCWVEGGNRCEFSADKKKLRERKVRVRACVPVRKSNRLCPCMSECECECEEGGGVGLTG